jgi:hypothetical protein
VRSGCEESCVFELCLGEVEVGEGANERTGKEGLFLSWSFFGLEKGRLRDEKSRVGIGRVESSSWWWGKEDIVLKVEWGCCHGWSTCMTLVRLWCLAPFPTRRSVPNPISHNHHPNTL